jgi:hypothetical protein
MYKMRRLMLPAALALSFNLASAAPVYIENFETGTIGSAPLGWNSSGGVNALVSGSINHTGQSSPWGGPAFGPSGSKSVSLATGAGAHSGSLQTVLSNSPAGGFAVSWSYFIEDGLTGSMAFRILGGNSVSNTDLIGEVFIDLATGVGTLTPTTGSVPGFVNGFSVDVATLSTSTGGSVYFDDFAVEDGASYANPGPPYAKEFPTGVGHWVEYMYQFDAAGKLICTHYPNYTIWTHVPEPNSIWLILATIAALIGSCLRSRAASPGPGHM